MPDLGDFGWAHLLTSVGLFLSATIAFLGFRTFDRWKREKIEERRIEVAFEALTLAYRTKDVFRHVRSPFAQSHEWTDMPIIEGEDEASRISRGPFYATLARLDFHKGFFDEAWRLQPKCMILLGRDIEGTFSKLHKARVRVQMSAKRLASRTTDRFGTSDKREVQRVERWERDVWEDYSDENEPNEVDNLLREFEEELEAAAMPTLNRKFKPRPNARVQ